MILLRVRRGAVMRDSAGRPVQSKGSAAYLGGALSADGAPRAELSRRTGEAWDAMLALERFWKHANIPRRRKQEVLKACVVPRLMYALDIDLAEEGRPS